MPLSNNFDAKEFETNINQKWVDSNLANPDSTINLQNQNQTFTVIAPPPNLTGKLHVGHALEHFMMDTVSRYKRQYGFDTLYFPGVDHAGIQLEGVITKLINSGEFDSDIDKAILEGHNPEVQSKSDFIKENHRELWLKLAWSKVNLWRDSQKEQSAIIGEIPDFSRLLFSLDSKSKDMVNYAFYKYWSDGLIYRSKYLINWSVGLQTALSDVPEDIGHREQNDPFVNFLYEFKECQFRTGEDLAIRPELNELIEYVNKNKLLPNLPIGTVRIETQFVDCGIAIHSETFKKYFNLEALKTISEKFRDSLVIEFIELIFKNQIKILYWQPVLGNNKVQLVIDDKFVDSEFGTGMVKITPAHSLTDYEMYHEFVELNKLDPISIQACIGRNGKLNSLANEFVGLTVAESRAFITKKLLENNKVPLIEDKVEALTESEIITYTEFSELSTESQFKYLQKQYPNSDIDWNYKHNVVICERSKTVVEPIISEEFFLSYKNQFEHKPILNWKKVDWTKVILESEKFILKPIQISDAQGLSQNMDAEDSDKIVSPVFETTTEAELWIESRIKEIQNCQRLTLSIFDNSNNKYAGYCGVRNEENEYKLTIWLTKEYQNNGFGKGIMSKLIDWCWLNLDTSELSWQAKNYNLGSIKLAKKLGFTEQTNQKNDNLVNLCIQKPKVNLQQLAINGIEQTTFIPKEYEARGINYINNLKDWCISRDLIWGIQIPVWYNLDLNPERKFYEAKNINDFVTINGSKFQISSLFRVQADKPIEQGNWVQETKILDTWFSSTLWPLSTLDYVSYIENYENTDFEKFYPTQLMTTAWEIFYAWVLRMILLGVYFTGQTPFETYCCHPWVLDEKGRKMSKSLGNVFDPTLQIQKYSSDSTRLAMLSECIPGKNMRFNGKLADRICEKYRNFGNKVWNVARFFEYKFNSINEVKYFPLSPASIWILDKYEFLLTELEANINQFDLSQSIELLYNFLWNEFADWYIEYLKVDESQLAFALDLFEQFIITLSPFSPFQAEIIWREFFKQNSLIAAKLQDKKWIITIKKQFLNQNENNESNFRPKSEEISLLNNQLIRANKFEAIIASINEIRSIKGLFNIAPNQPINVSTTDSKLIESKEYIQLMTKAIFIHESKVEMYKINRDDYLFEIDILSHINDKNIEIDKTNKLIIKIRNEIEIMEKVLNNPTFIQNAKHEIIQEKQQQIRIRNEDLKVQLQKLEILK
jgi:valyl-tRNA synthetase